MKKQNGAVSLLGLIFLLMFLFIIFLGVKLVPAYVDDATIRAAVSSVQNEPELRQKTAGEVREVIHKRLYVNDFSGRLGMTPEKKAIQINTDNGIRIDVDYQVKTHLFYNVDAIQTFKHHYHFGGQ